MFCNTVTKAFKARDRQTAQGWLAIKDETIVHDNDCSFSSLAMRLRCRLAAHSPQETCTAAQMTCVPLRTRTTVWVCRPGRHGGRDRRTDGHRCYSYSITLSLAGASAQWEFSFCSRGLVVSSGVWPEGTCRISCDSKSVT